jgi:hypothetical protein
MSTTRADAVAEAWRKVAEKLAPLAANAAAAAAAEHANPEQPSLIEELSEPLMDSAAAVEVILSRTTGLVPAAFSESVPHLLFKAVS